MDVCFCCPPAGGLFRCGDGCFCMLGHLEIEGSPPKRKLLTQSFKIISDRKFFNCSDKAYICIFEVNIFFRGRVHSGSSLIFR